MATTMTTAIGPLLWSSDIPELEFSTDAEELSVTVVVGTDVLLDIVQSAYNNKVKVWNVRDVVERYLLHNHLATALVNITVTPSGDSANTVSSFTVVYCSKSSKSSVSQWCSLNFLTTARYKVLTAGMVDTLYFFAEAAGPLQIMYHVTTLTPSNEVRVVDVDGETVTAPALSVISVPLDLSALEEEVESDVIGVAVRVGGRVLNYYRVEPSPTAGFVFYNCFNVPELVSLSCSTTSKVKDDRKVARVSRRSVLYNALKRTSYEVVTSPMRLDLARWLEELSTSVRTWLSDGTPIVITEYEVELSDDHAAANVIKFTWQRSYGESLLELRSSGMGIFQAPFTYQFE